MTYLQEEILLGLVYFAQSTLVGWISACMSELMAGEIQQTHLLNYPSPLLITNINFVKY